MRVYDEEEDLASTLDELILDVSDGALEIPSDAPGKYLLASLVLEEILKRGVLHGKDSPAPLDADPDEDKVFH